MANIGKPCHCSCSAPGPPRRSVGVGISGLKYLKTARHGWDKWLVKHRKTSTSLRQSLLKLGSVPVCCPIWTSTNWVWHQIPKCSCLSGSSNWMVKPQERHHMLKLYSTILKQAPHLWVSCPRISGKLTIAWNQNQFPPSTYQTISRMGSDPKAFDKRCKHLLLKVLASVDHQL